MLTIENIEKLNDKYLGKNWQVAEARACRPMKWLPTEHYSISLGRSNSGAAILIWRNINPLTKQYHVHLCYNSFDNVIYEGSFTKKVIMDKENFLASMMGYINAEYEMRKK
jgi:hypothetical protein